MKAKTARKIPAVINVGGLTYEQRDALREKFGGMAGEEITLRTFADGDRVCVFDSGLGLVALVVQGNYDDFYFLGQRELNDALAS